MGASASSKFLAAIKNGDETSAIQLYTTEEKLSAQLRLCEVGGGFNKTSAKRDGSLSRGSTPLHHICDFALADLLEIVLPTGKGYSAITATAYPEGKTAEGRSNAGHSTSSVRQITVTVPPDKYFGQVRM
eukprot:jgi/Bigna1/68042/fgenesh1_pg.5_\